MEGNYDQLVGKIQELYGQSRADVERDLDNLIRSEPVR